jgi:hypothetical protein
LNQFWHFVFTALVSHPDKKYPGAGSVAKKKRDKMQIELLCCKTGIPFISTNSE